MIFKTKSEKTREGLIGGTCPSWVCCASAPASHSQTKQEKNRKGQQTKTCHN